MTLPEFPSLYISAQVEHIMSNVDFGRYKRIVQAFWDPEPRNDDTSGASIWCLGKEYTSRPLPSAVQDSPPKADQEAPALTNGEAGHQDSEGTWPSATNGAPGVEPEVDRGWPPDFLDDCESRAWFTYRSNFPPIKKSSDASMTLAVRLRSLGDQAGFTSDTGWGCMIRSGQSLLANALVMLQLGRGTSSMAQTPEHKLTVQQTGGEEDGRMKRGSFCLSLLMIPALLSQYTGS